MGSFAGISNPSSNWPPGFIFAPSTNIINNAGVSLTFPPMSVIDKTNTLKMSFVSAQNVANNVSGLNGLLKSSNLTGTVSTGGVASTSVVGSGTHFTTQLKPGDFLFPNSGTGACVQNIVDDTHLTTFSNATINAGTTYARGGNISPKTWYNFYLISNGAMSYVCASNRNANAGDSVDLNNLPAGYSFWRQLPIQWPTDGSGNWDTNYNVTGFPFSPRGEYGSSESPLITNNMNATVPTPVNVSTYNNQPSLACEIEALVNNNGASGNFFISGTNGGSSSLMKVINLPANAETYLNLDFTNQLQAECSVGTMSVSTYLTALFFPVV